MSSAINPTGGDRPTGSERPAAEPRDTRDDRVRDHGSRPVAPATPAAQPTTRDVVRAQKERFGGMKFGSCFFGWLTASGTGVLLAALLAAAGAAFGLGQNVTAAQANVQGGDLRTVGIVGGIVLLVIVFVSYLAGGYVAGRMARFNGLRQGLGVWLWSIIAAVVVAVLTLVAGSKFNVLANLNGFPRIPVDEGDLTTAGIITAVIVVVAALVGALLGGLAGMAYHRRVDKADFDFSAVEN